MHFNALILRALNFALLFHPEKNLDRKFWKLGRVAYLPMETDVDGDNLKSLNAPGFRGVAQCMLKYRDPHSS